ncbi:hypothetical protein D9M71_507730 [compost metagenome]
MASSTCCRVPVAFFAIPFCRASASRPSAFKPAWNRLGCWVAIASSRIMALVAVPATSADAPRVRKVEPKAAASLNDMPTEAVMPAVRCITSMMSAPLDWALSSR